MKQIVPVLLLVAVVGCATFNPKEEERGLSAVISLLNKGDGDALAELSSIPFLFDAEILLVKQDVEILWKNAVKAGFTIANPRIVDIEPADTGMAKLFSDSMEVEVFFKKYIPKRAVFARVQSDSGTYLFILGDHVGGLPTIVAFKGPTP
jgi:hypothetical protein